MNQGLQLYLVENILLGGIFMGLAIMVIGGAAHHQVV
jgi:hypothetical protein